MIELLYVDPGNGSYLIQVIIAAVLGVLFYIKSIWYWIKSFFTNTPSKSDEEKTDDTP